MKIYKDVFEKIVSPENLFNSWTNFKHDKRKRLDVQEFEINLEENIFKLRRELKTGIYKHGPYKPFYIHDPKQRLIHKATVRDRVVHHAIYSILNPIFEPTFIANSFSCRVGKGTHKGVKVLERMLVQVSWNNTRNCFALKCDIKRFFDSINHKVLLAILNRRIKDRLALNLLGQIVESYSSENFHTHRESKGFPIGNLTSQLFANIYMNKFDYFIKHKLKVKNYLRYTDDFVFVGENKDCLERLIEPINKFLKEELKLSLHPHKVSIRKYKQGIDFLGYVILPHHIVVRTKTKRRILRKLNKGNLTSYLGVLYHSNSYELAKELRELWGSLFDQHFKHCHYPKMPN